MKIDSKTTPESMLSPPEPILPATMRFEDGRAEIIFMPLRISARAHGITFGADDGPAIILGRRKVRVEGIY